MSGGLNCLKDGACENTTCKLLQERASANMLAFPSMCVAENQKSK